MARKPGLLAGALSGSLYLLLSLSSAFAEQAQELVFEPPEDLVLMWAKRAGLAVTICSVMLILIALVVRRHRLMEASSKWLLFLGLCALPVPVLFLSGGVGMHESKNVDFCESCHVPMGPFVQDMRDPKSETLSAVHYQNRFIQKEQCWTCHSNYGITGTTSAKLTGLLHIFKVASDSWEAPIKLYKPYNWTICLQCHAQSARFRKPLEDDTAHEGVVDGVLKGEVTCVDCHHPSAHPPREDRSTK